MIEIYAPHPNWEHVIFLPNPEWGDFRRLNLTTQVKRSMTGNTIITHVQKHEDLKSVEMSFTLTRMKSLEMLAFLDLHIGHLLKIVDHRDDVHIGYMQVNPLELEKVRKGTNGEQVKLNLNFESVE